MDAKCSARNGQQYRTCSIRVAAARKIEDEIGFLATPVNRRSQRWCGGSLWSPFGSQILFRGKLDFGGSFRHRGKFLSFILFRDTKANSSGFFGPLKRPVSGCEKGFAG